MLFTSDGSAQGIIDVALAKGLKVKQRIVLSATSLPNLEVRIIRVYSRTQIKVGIINPPQGQWFKGVDVSAYTVALGAFLYAAEQDKAKVSLDDMEEAVYDQEPTVAWRGVAVDQFGDYYDSANPLPVIFAGSITTTVRRLTDKPNDGTPDNLPDAIQIGDGTNRLHINADGSINVDIGGSPTVQTVKSFYNEISSVASGVQTLIVSYTVPVGKTAQLQWIDTSGDNVARYDVYLNGAPFDTQRTFFGGDFNALFEYITGNTSGLTFVAGDVIAVKVLHTRPYVGKFEGRIQVLEIS
jgi:hypothetical protein